MDEKDRSTDDKTAAEARHTGKKPYHKPTFRYEHVFETMALACGKTSPVVPNCKFGRRRNS
jgi:hypothetical protein